jgi:AGZA family xanthine/uracil permease-like MFS transporter
MLESVFKLREHGTTVGTEMLAGVTTFMVMAYIIFVNPAILSFASVPGLQGQGVPFGPTIAATCLAAALTTAAMGLVTNYPLALAPGMGINAVVAFQLIAGHRLPWPVAMGVVVLEGMVITLLVLTGFREAVMNAIPLSQKRAISVGIGLFILFIGLFNGGIVKAGTGIPVTLGPLTSPPVAVAIAGLALTILLIARRVRSALLLGILLTTLLAVAVNGLGGGKVWTLPGVAVVPSRLVAWPDFSTVGAGLNFEVFARLGVLAAGLAIFSLMLSDFFDTMGTVVGIATEAGWLGRDGRLPRMNRVLLVDSLAAVAGGIGSASSATTYIESAAGVAAGGRTGLTAMVVALGFALALFLAPLAGIVPPEATAATLIVVGYLMCTIVRDIPFGDLEEGLPALLTMTVMPFTYSITNGIGAGFIAYAFIKVVRGKGAEVHPLMYGAAAAFVAFFAAH